MTAKKKSRSRKPRRAGDTPVSPIFDRFQDDHGVWCYRDTQEAEFVIWMLPEIPMTSIDDFIEGRQCDAAGKRFSLPDNMRNDLLEMRREALQAFRSDRRAEAVALAGMLHERCQRFGQYFAAKPAVISALARDKSLPKARKKAAKNKKAEAKEKYAALTKIVKRESWKHSSIEKFVQHCWPEISALDYYSETTAIEYAYKIRKALRKS